MKDTPPRFAGVELYFEDLEAAKKFYEETLGLKVADEERGHFAKFISGPGFVCLERKGSESYPSRDKAVLFFEVDDLEEAIEAVGRDRFAHVAADWAVMHDPEGHNVLLMRRRA
jgi:predicted enzyme related to lactoylglutathione lyase